MRRETAVAFSGHRLIAPANQHSLFGWDTDTPEYHWNYMTGATPAFTKGVNSRLGRVVGKLIDEGYDTFICGMATGFDLMAGEALCDIMDAGSDISIISAIPFPGQADRYKEADRLLYNRILDHSSEICTVCGAYSRDCFHRRNDFLVDNASVLVCFYNGSPGGTQYTVKKALKQGLKIINLI